MLTKCKLHVNVGTPVDVSFITVDIFYQFDKCCENLIYHVVEMEVITRYVGQKGLENNKALGREAEAPSSVPSMGHLSFHGFCITMSRLA